MAGGMSFLMRCFMRSVPQEPVDFQIKMQV